MKPASSVPGPHPDALWRSPETCGCAQSAGGRTDEFSPGVSGWPKDLNRRHFIQLVGASLALAGLDGCARRAAERIVPQVTPPEFAAVPDRPLAFTSAAPFAGYARGILVTSHSGRPTKIEGNPDHPESLGATDVFTQAAILSLYDPDRSKTPARSSLPATWAAFENEWLARRGAMLDRRGAGFALLTEPTTSPTLLREIHRVLDTFPEARWFQHDPLASQVSADAERGGPADFDFAAADVILTLQSDCFYQHPSAARYGAAFASRRRIKNGEVHPPRFYAIEATPTVTGALADFRLPASPSRMRLLLDAVAQALAAQGESPASAHPALSAAEQTFVEGLVADLRAHSGAVACIAGPECDPDVRQWADALNARLGGKVTRRLPTVRSDADPRGAGDLRALAAALGRGEVHELFILGGNPVYTGLPDLDLGEKIRRVEFTVHLDEYPDETASCVRWHLPAPHFLETWSDLRAYGGVATIQQPLVEPLHASRSPSEVLRFLSSPPGASAYDLVRETWRGSASPVEFETHWHRWLVTGVVEEDKKSTADEADPANANDNALPRLFSDASATPEGFTILFQPDPNILDGRWANNAWLQELPKPLTKLVWDNAALISPQLAFDENLVNGDIVRLELNGRHLDAPVWVMPGQAPEVVTLSFGYGRTRAGSTGNHHGYDAYRLRAASALWHETGARFHKLGQRHALVSTQEHFTMEGRDLVRVASPAAAASPHEHESREPQTSLYPGWERGRYAWGMSIDLATCLGCNACVLACQAENNIPVVGKDQVARGREMHWLRVDRYFSGHVDNPRFLHQPVPCMHCENAPCEVVCPVAATVHSSEGLNDMIYNRCVGTRYCSNNCPYKVRRFNFLDYRPPEDSPVYLQANPQVTIRERGVMEKCTYCVQRINSARIVAERESRPIRDGEIKTACQQVCPANAIVFGDLNDPTNQVSRRKEEPTSYALLGELNTRPRTTYLAVVRHDHLA